MQNYFVMDPASRRSLRNPIVKNFLVLFYKREQKKKYLGDFLKVALVL